MVTIPERCPSGLRSTPGKCVYVNSVSRVRIPLSPPKIKKAPPMRGFFVSTILSGFEDSSDAKRHWVRQICPEQIWSLERSGSARRVKTRMVLNNPSLSAKNQESPAHAGFFCIHHSPRVASLECRRAATGFTYLDPTNSRGANLQ